MVQGQDKILHTSYSVLYPWGPISAEALSHSSDIIPRAFLLTALPDLAPGEVDQTEVSVWVGENLEQ